MLTAAVLLSGGYIYLGGSDVGHQGDSLSDHCKTCIPLQKGDHSLPKAFLEDSSTLFNSLSCGSLAGSFDTIIIVY